MENEAEQKMLAQQEKLLSEELLEDDLELTEGLEEIPV